MYSWGRGAGGRLGHGDELDCVEPRLIQSLCVVEDVDEWDGSDGNRRNGVQIVMAACGWSHSACLSAGGAVYTFGRGRDGALGHANTLDVLQPKRVQYPGWGTSSRPLGGASERSNAGNGDGDSQSLMDRVVQVSAGSCHTAVLTIRRHVWTWGWGQHGQVRA